jgi:Tol biopolymer transport system component
LLARAKSLTKTDRGRIVFDSDRTGAPDFVKPDVYVVPSDGTAERQLTFATRLGEFSRMPALSPDGRSIVFQGNREVEGRGLYVMNRSNGNVTRVIAGQAAQPAWSPDGRQIWG